MKTLYAETTVDCSICGECIDLIDDHPDYFMGEPAHLNCASQMREEIRMLPRLILAPIQDIDDIIA